VSLNDDRDWASRIYRERAQAINEDQNVTYFFLKNYQEICRYLRTIGYGTKGKAEPVEHQVARELESGAYCDLRTTVRGKRSTQDIAVFVYRDPTGNLVGSGKVSHVIQESELTTELELPRKIHGRARTSASSVEPLRPSRVWLAGTRPGAVKGVGIDDLLLDEVPNST
jgi:hypothetical protein